MVGSDWFLSIHIITHMEKWLCVAVNCCVIIYQLAALTLQTSSCFPSLLCVCARLSGSGHLKQWQLTHLAHRIWIQESFTYSILWIYLALLPTYCQIVESCMWYLHFGQFISARYWTNWKCSCLFQVSTAISSSHQTSPTQSLWISPAPFSALHHAEIQPACPWPQSAQCSNQSNSNRQQYIIN